MRDKTILCIKNKPRVLWIIFIVSYLYACEIDFEIETIPSTGPICWLCWSDTTTVYLDYNNRISPPVMKVKTGTTIRFANIDSVSHKLATTNTTSFVLDTLRPGDLANYRTGSAGTINYYCTLHVHGATLVITP